MSKIVYLVTQKDIQDCDMVIAAFSTKEKAEAFIKDRELEDAEIDFATLDPMDPQT